MDGDVTALTKMVRYWVLWGSSQIHPLYFYLDFYISILPDISTWILLSLGFFENICGIHELGF